MWGGGGWGGGGGGDRLESTVKSPFNFCGVFFFFACVVVVFVRFGGCKLLI